MSSGGGNVLESVTSPELLSGKGNFFENLGNDIINYGTQYGTFGLMGFQDGKLSSGVTTDVAVGGIKEVTGAAAAEEANRLARQQFEESKANADKARAEAQAQVGRDQMAQSVKAGAARSAGRSSANRGQGLSSVALGEDERDFLGL